MFEQKWIQLLVIVGVALGATQTQAAGASAGATLSACPISHRTYRLVDLGAGPGLPPNPAGQYVLGTVMNNFGEVAGSYQLSPSGTYKSFFYTHSTMLDFDQGLPAGYSTYLNGLNNKHQIAGNMDTPGGVSPFRWDNGVFTFLPQLPSVTISFARSLNDVGDAAGISEFSAADWRPTLWLASGQVKELPTAPNTAFNEPTAMNRKRQIIGTSAPVPCCGNAGGIYWDEFQQVHQLGQNSTLSSINDRGDIVGADIVNGLYAATLWHNLSPTTLTIPGAVFSFGLGINNRGDILGQAGDGTRRWYFVIENGVYHNLTALLPPAPSGWELSAISINDGGQILLLAYQNIPPYNFQWHTLRADPVCLP